MSREEGAAFLGVSLRTVGNWETGTTRPPYAAFKLLRVLRHGDLPDARWSGYRIIRGRLITPEGHGFHPGDMAWLSLLVRRAGAFTDLLHAYHAASDELARLERERTGSTGQTPRAGRGPVDAAVSAAVALLEGRAVVECGGGAMPLEACNDGLNNNPPHRGGDVYRESVTPVPESPPPSVKAKPPHRGGDVFACAAVGGAGARPPCSNTGMLQPPQVARSGGAS